MEKDISYWNKLAIEAITDEEAFTEIYKYFYPRVYRFIFMKTNSYDVADEMISRVFYKMYNSLKNYNPERAAFSTWLYQIAISELKTFYRFLGTNKFRSEQEGILEDGVDTAAPDVEEPERQILRNEENSELYEALKKLSERERKIIEMTYWLNYPPRKIAEILDMKPNTVSVALKRAKANLKKFLEDSSQS